MSEDRKLTLGSGKLGVNKGGDSGRARQNLGQGRSKPVVVERKKRRIFKKDAPEGLSPTKADDSATAKPTLKPSSEKAETTLTSAEQEARAAALKQAAADEAKRKAEAEARAKAEADEKKKRAAAEKAAAEAAAEAAAKEAAVEAAKPASEKAVEVAPAVSKEDEAEEAARRMAEEAAQKAAQEKAKKKKEAEARKAAEQQQNAGGDDKARQDADAARMLAAKRALDAKRADADEEEPARKKKADKKKVHKPARGQDDRRRGKLSVNRAFEGDEGGRQRSMASLKRAQAKHKRQMVGDDKPKQKKKREVVVPEAITVQELSNRMAEKVTDVIKFLMGMGVLATINEVIDQDTAELVVTEFGHELKRVSDADVEEGLFGDADVDEDMISRAPVITVMGHVDHGKTSLLDALRKTDVVSGEAGGITQHIGAYQVTIAGGQKMTFLDTPGHEAFTAMRARGASVTDVVILVVAADDGIMPQTIEAISHAKAAGVPMIVAINKIDKEGANPDRVRQELLQHEVVVEAYSGDVIDVEVSAKHGQGLDKLQEMILLQAEMLDLKANPDRNGEGVVVEAQLDKGRGPVATVLVKRGTLSVGDVFVAGAEWGKVRALINDHGQQVDSAGPSQPVEILGLNGTPAAGDDFAVVESESRAREITSYRQEKAKNIRVGGTNKMSLEAMFTAMKENKAEEFPILVKGDVQGSIEAINGALEKLGNDEIQARIIHGAVGGITESDVILAHASNAPIIGFNVRANKQAREHAARDGVPIQYFSIIYDLVDFVKEGMEGRLAPMIEENVIGYGEVKDVFSAGKAGKAAGVFVTDGSIKRDAKVRLTRNDVVIYEGQMTNLRRFKDDVNEVRAGTECGMTLENYTDMKTGDNMEFYELVESARTL